jgi:carboxymethylenebutenolidase
MTQYTLLLSLLSLLLIVSVSAAQDATTQPARPKIPPTGQGDVATKALADSPRHGEWVDVALPGTDTKIRTWVVHPERSTKAPIVLVIFDIRGMGDWVRAVGDQLAADGFIALVPDLLSGMGPNGGGTDSLGDQVGQTIRTLGPEDQAKKLDAVREYGLKLPNANGKSASLGFCWGGAASFSYAARQPKLSAAVVFYGSPPEQALLAKIECPVLGLYGGNDARITATVEPTKQAMAELKKTYETHVYEGAGHGFTRNQSGQNGANQRAIEQAWPTVVAFLKKNVE